MPTTTARRRTAVCAWCGREVVSEGPGRTRKYCKRSCRQRAYESRAALAGTPLPADSVVLSAQEAESLSERMFEVRCAAEDVQTAVAEGASPGELELLCARLVDTARSAERIR
ncbi:hypothetical protein P0W64_13995 [Tsukamurella sp. 8F]|uniref:hypothetical protein n=1 Tax=unclassified Tsukamurella TaxID=2633480 RepID=UPI0023B98FB9|nr:MULTISPECIES: hypothetical protein [unclassified Tsukamurella]MDF0530685.1 hypothetical protein [Tsukamurella sp. 8J]MDF0587886.1 hypothetical protein [Tsukamurella sp. 8F]